MPFGSGLSIDEVSHTRQNIIINIYIHICLIIYSSKINYSHTDFIHTLIMIQFSGFKVACVLSPLILLTIIKLKYIFVFLVNMNVFFFFLMMINYQWYHILLWTWIQLYLWRFIVFDNTIQKKKWHISLVQLFYLFICILLFCISIFFVFLL